MGEARRKRIAAEWAKVRTVRCHYLHVIEWLGDGDTKTGTKLAGLVRDKHGIPVRLASCRSAAEVIEQLYWAAEQVPEHGVPIIHFEAHGLEPAHRGTTSDGLQGPNGLGGLENLYWDAIAVPLRLLNVATEFRLLVVGAACYSLATLSTIDINEVAPFQMLFGFNSKVHPTRLLLASRELYRSLFTPELTLSDALTNARNELHQETEDEFLQATDVYVFALDMVHQIILDELDPVYRSLKNMYLSKEILAARGDHVPPDEINAQFPGV